MTTCNHCKHYFPLDEDQTKGDCVRRVEDQRQSYYQSKPVEANKDASSCPFYSTK